MGHDGNCEQEAVDHPQTIVSPTSSADPGVRGPEVIDELRGAHCRFPAPKLCRGAYGLRVTIADPGGRRLDALDGVRTFAVGTVVALHSNFGHFPGGGVGVDLFLVLSGYLITTLLLDERGANGRIAVGRFYVRRALRLYPALAAVIAMVILTALVIDDPRQQMHLDRGALLSALVAGLYLTDIAIGWGWRPEMAQDLSLFHTWSLSVEEHFYLLWAPTLAYVVSKFKKLSSLLLGIGVAIAASLMWTMVLGATRPDPYLRIAYSFDTRGVGLLFGCALAVLVRQHPALAIPKVAPWAGLAILAAATQVDLPGSAAAAPFLIIVNIASCGIVLGCLSLGSSFEKFWSHQLFVSVGRRAYGIYLWHFPIFYVISAVNFPNLGTALIAVLKVAVLVVAVEISYRCVEKPALKLRHRFTPKRGSDSTV